MSTFSIFIQLGLEHILDLKGYDHILFIIALCVMYTVREWKRVLILITAFTVGHSITLALSTLNIINIPSSIIEFLIPVTIFLTAFRNITRKELQFKKDNIHIGYILASFFGLIHGLGFSNYLKSLLGKDRNIITELLAFNLGLEIGQIVVVATFLIISFILIFFINVKPRDWRLIISSAIAGITITLMIDTAFW